MTIAAALGTFATIANADDGSAPASNNFTPALRIVGGDATPLPVSASDSRALSSSSSVSNGLISPAFTMDAAPPQTVYGPPQAPSQQPGVNAGGTHVQLTFDYNNHYIYRGVDHSLTGGRGDSANLESQAQINFDIGPISPFVGVFSNVYDSDPVSRFQEIRPFFGVELNLRPLTLSGGDTAYLYPDRSTIDTAEVWGKIELDDGYVFGLDQPILTPYVFGAYDYDKNKGWYFEAGLQHNFTIEQTGITITPFGDVGYILNFQQQFVFVNNKNDTGFQHYDVGLKATFSLNTLLNVPSRYGAFNLTARLVDTGKIDKELDADNVVWGGLGVEFKY